MNSVVDGYRSYLSKTGQNDTRPDWAITLDLGNRLRSANRDAEAPADFWGQYEQIRANRDPGQMEGIVNSAKNAWDSSMQGLQVLGGVSDEDAQDIADREKAIRERPTNMVWENWQRAKGLDAFKTFLRDPAEITSNIVASGFAGSAPGMIGGMAGGAAGGSLAGSAVLPGIGTGVGGAVGAALGTFPGSLAVEYGNKYLSVLREAGADLADPESIRRVIQDPEVKAKAMEMGLRRGIPVAAFDAISAALGGKFFGHAAVKQGTRQMIKEGAVEGLVQGGFGGAGEVAGAVSAGEDIDGKEVFEEVVGELGPGAVEVGGGVIRDRYFGGHGKAAPAVAAPTANSSQQVSTATTAPAPAAINMAAELRRFDLLTPEQRNTLFADLSALDAATLTPAQKLQLNILTKAKRKAAVLSPATPPATPAANAASVTPPVAPAQPTAPVAAPAAVVQPAPAAPAVPAATASVPAPTPASAQGFALPRNLAGAKPRYSYGSKQFELSFSNDLDRALYIISQDKPTGRDADYLKLVMDATGLDAAGARAAGANVRSAIKAIAKDAQGGGTIAVPTVYASAAPAAKPAPAPAPALAPSLAQAVAPAAAPLVKAPTLADRLREVGKVVKGLPSELAKPILDRSAQVRDEAGVSELERMASEATATAAARAAEAAKATEVAKAAKAEQVRIANAQNAEQAAAKAAAKGLKEFGSKAGADRLALLRSATARTPEEVQELAMREQKLAQYQARVVELANQPRSAAQQGEYQTLTQTLKRYMPKEKAAPAGVLVPAPGPDSILPKTETPTTEVLNGLQEKEGQGLQVAPAPAPQSTGPDTLATSASNALDTDAAAKRVAGFAAAPKVSSVVTVPEEAVDSVRLGGARFREFLESRKIVFADDANNKAKTRTAVVLEAPDGTHLMRGLLLSKDSGTRSVDGSIVKGEFDVQAMSKGGTGKSQKAIDTAGNTKIPLRDLVAAGYKVREVMTLAGPDGKPIAPGKIAENFAGPAEYAAARTKTEFVPGAEWSEPTQKHALNEPMKDSILPESGMVHAPKDANGETMDAEQMAPPPSGQTETITRSVSTEADIRASLGTKLDTILENLSRSKDPEKALTKIIDRDNQVFALTREIPGAEQAILSLHANRTTNAADSGTTTPVGRVQEGERGAPRAAQGRPEGAANLGQPGAVDGESVALGAVRGDSGADAGRLTNLDKALASKRGVAFVTFVAEKYGKLDAKAVRRIGLSERVSDVYLNLLLKSGVDAEAFAAAVDERVAAVTKATPESAGEPVDSARVDSGARADVAPIQLSDAATERLKWLVNTSTVTNFLASEYGRFDAEIYGQLKPNSRKAIDTLIKKASTSLEPVSFEQLAVVMDDAIKDALKDRRATPSTAKALDGLNREQLQAIADEHEARGEAVPQPVQRRLLYYVTAELVADGNSDDADARVDAGPDPVATIRHDGARMIESLRNLGADVRVVQRETVELLTGVRHSVGAHLSEAKGLHLIMLATHDAASATLRNIATLFHEVGHALFADASPQMRRTLERAITGAVGTDLRAKLAESTADNKNASAEEMLVESVAQRLASEGVDTSLAARVVRLVKELYMRSAQSLYRMFGKELSDAQALAWFENTLRRTVGGDFDHGLTNFWRPLLKPTMEQEAARHTATTSTPVNYWDGTRMMQPRMLADTVEAALWNLKVDTEDSMEFDAKTQSFIPGAAKRDVAANKEILSALVDLADQLKVDVKDLPKLWKTIARGTLPSTIIERLVAESPEAGTASIGGAEMNDSTNGHALREAYRLAMGVVRTAKRKIHSVTTSQEKLVAALEKAIPKHQKLEVAYRDSAVMESEFQDALRAQIKLIAADEASLERGAHAQGELAAAIRLREGLTKGDAIPEGYQRVFRSILDGNVRFFDYFQELAKLNLPLKSMDIADVVDAIKDGATTNPTLKQLSENRELMLSVAALARDSAKQMDLLQLRVMTDRIEKAAIHAELEEIRTASSARLAELLAGLRELRDDSPLRARLAYAYLKSRQAIEHNQRIIRKQDVALGQLEAAARVFSAKAKTFEETIGIASAWEANDGAEYTAMVRDGHEWVAETRTLNRSKDGGGLDNPERIQRDIAFNKLWLEQNKENKGRDYREIERQTQELAKSNARRRYTAMNMWFMDKLIMPLAQQLGATGTWGGNAAKKRLLRQVAITDLHSDAVRALANKWAESFRKVAALAGQDHKEFVNTTYSRIWQRIHGELDVADDASVFRIAAHEAAKVIGEAKVTPQFREQLNRFLLLTKQNSEFHLAIAKQEGLAIADKGVIDPATGKPILRGAIKYGWATIPQIIRTEVIEAVNGTMTRAGWANGVASIVSDLKGVLNDEDAPMDAAALDQAIWAELPASLSEYFTEEIVRNFVDPFARKPGRPVFEGLADKDGVRAALDQSHVEDVWNESNGDITTFIKGLYELGQTLRPSEETLVQYAEVVLGRFDALYRMEARIVEEASGLDDPKNPGARRHRLMDARQNDILPPEHLAFDVFDPQSARVALGEIAHHAAMGRDGKGMQGDLNSARAELAGRNLAYLRVMSGSRSEYAAKAKAEGYDLKELKRAHEQFTRIDALEAQIKGLSNRNSSSGPLGEVRTFMEVVQANMMLVLNTFKSGLWNVASLADFPMKLGLGRAGVTASGKAALNLAHGMAGSLLSSVGLNILKATEIQKTLGQISGSQNSRSTLVEMLSDTGSLGPAGSPYQNSVGGRVKQGVGIMRSLMSKGIGSQEDTGFGVNNALHSPFQWLSREVNHAVAVANVQAFEVLLRKAVTYFEQHPGDFNDTNFRFTADNLGMAGKFFSDQRAFDYYRNTLADYRMGDIEDVARGALARAREGSELLTKDQVMMLGVMAKQEISLESSINTRPIAFFNNPIIAIAGTMLGWPISRMNQTHEMLRTAEGRYEPLSVLKGLGVLAAWTLPVGLAYTFLMDDYDDEILRKKSTLPNMGASVKVGDNMAAALQRGARSGIYGLGGDAIASMVNVIDPKSGVRDFSLDSRVLVFSQFANLRDIVRNVIAQEGAMTYQSTGRGLITALGGNGLLQYTQIFNGLMARAGMPLSNAEAEVVARINATTTLRSAGRAAGLEVKGGGAMRASPTPMSVWVREMQLAAYGNDRLQFLEAYRKAIAAAQKAGDADPQKAVIASWKSRSPLSMFPKLTDTQKYKLFQAMDEDGRRDAQSAIAAYDAFSRMIVPAKAVSFSQRDPFAIRQRAAGW